MTAMNDVSGVILAGGLSSRMGKNKAELKFHGVTLLEHQISKLRSLGIEDIVISGYERPIVGTRFVPDKYPLKGPLGGIHSGLCAAKNGSCLVTSVDTPLVPEKLLRELVSAHIAGGHSMTVLSHGDKLEPLIGVYEKSLAALAEDILRTDNTSVRVLLKRGKMSEFVYSGDEALLCDCNTPEEFSEAALMAGDR